MRSSPKPTAGECAHPSVDSQAPKGAIKTLGTPVIAVHAGQAHPMGSVATVVVSPRATHKGVEAKLVEAAELASSTGACGLVLDVSSRKDVSAPWLRALVVTWGSHAAWRPVAAVVDPECAPSLKGVGVQAAVDGLDLAVRFDGADALKRARELGRLWALSPDAVYRRAQPERSRTCFVDRPEAEPLVRAVDGHYLH